jgi:hypothetical protein
MMLQSHLDDLIDVRRELACLRSYRDIAGWCEAEERRYLWLIAEEGDLVELLTPEDRVRVPSR